MIDETSYESKFRTTFISDGGICFQPIWADEAARGDIEAQVGARACFGTTKIVSVLGSILLSYT